MNKTELINKIKTLEGLSNEEKADLLQLLNEQKKYGIVWEDKPEDVEQQLAEQLPMLTEVKERRIKGATPDSPNHILIEGDNLHALTALSYTHEGKIDVIYIDPPYNTGNSASNPEDDANCNKFMYNDKFVDEKDSYRHSKWLSFMHKRLTIAKQLLSDNGVIFISIDDNEQARLKLLCDEVFGEKNCITQFVWEKTQHFGRQAKNFYSNNEYILCYCKNLYYEDDDKLKLKQRIVENFNSNLQDAPLYNASNPEKTLVFPKGSVKFNIADGEYSTTTDTKYKLCSKVVVRNSVNDTPLELKMRSRWSADKIIEEYNNGCKFWVKTKNFAIRAIYPPDRTSITSPRQIIFTNINNPLSTKSYYTNNIDTTENGSKELLKIIGISPFKYPKPSSLIKYLIGMVYNAQTNSFESSATILDFFAGSGTTLHATMQLNKEDGGKRQCILVTNNENSICENVTYERNKRVINGYTTPKGNDVEGLKNNTLRYYKTDFVPATKSQKNRRKLMSTATDLLCIKNNIYNEESLFAGKKWAKSKARYFEENGRGMLVIYDESAVSSIVEALAGMAIENKIMIYVFSNTNYAYNDEFQEVADKVELCALPDAIYRAYTKITREIKKSI
ncbi:MAG: site-specific DNA-methyltransferase [Bacteroidales bacterium]|nr:site-specific DNA-methyltransferase [Bacteroidales bacterium]